MNLDCRFVVVWPQRQTFVRLLLQHQNRSLLRADVRRSPRVALEALGQILGRYTGFDSAIAQCRGSPKACEQGGRHGFRVFAPCTTIRAFAPKVVLLLLIMTVEEVFNCRSVHPKVNM